MALMNIPLLEKLFRLILGGTFIWAAWSKILDPGGFAQVVENYRLLPLVWVNLVAVVLPFLELICGICLITGLMYGGSLVLIDIMLLIFIILFIANIFRGLDVSCGCFSTDLQLKGNVFWYMLRDLGFLAMGSWLFISHLRHLRAIDKSL